MLNRKHLPGATDSGLHFVGDEDNPVLFADLFHHWEKFFWWYNESALAQHRFGNHRRHRIRRYHAFERVLQMTRAAHIARWIGEVVRAAVTIRVRNPVDVAGKWRKACLIRIGLA